ncbi:MAG: 4Fe-4S binding protein [Candidatus Nezhaarchaeales archaeon]
MTPLKKWYEIPIGATNTEPGSSLKYLTSSWRTFTPVIDRSRCIKCYLCWIFCPEGAIELEDDGFTKINYLYCKGCGICSNECPSKAIVMRR